MGLGINETLAGFDGGTVAGDVANQAVGMGRADEGFMGGGRELGVGEFGEGAGEGGFVRELAGVIPAAQLAQAMVGFERFEELAGVSQAVDAFLARKARAMARRSLLGRPGQRPCGSKERRGTMAQTAMKRAARSLMGPTAGVRSGKSCCWRTLENWESCWGRVSCMWLKRDKGGSLAFFCGSIITHITHLYSIE